MGKLEAIARWVLGLILLFFGSNGLFNFMPQPEMTGVAGQFFGGLAASGYFIPFMGLVMVAVGLSLVINKWMPVALVILAPISIQIILYHVFIDLPTILPGLLVFLLNIYLGVKHFDAYRPMFK